MGLVGGSSVEQLNSLGLTLVSFIFVLGVLIFVHELGHYLVAKALGIRVEVFSLGFGTRLIGFQRGDTDYRVSLIPLGGYVKMAGDNPDDELSGSPEEFLSRPKHHRFAVAIAGPLMNLGLALLLLAVNFMVGVPTLAYQQEPAVVGSVVEGSTAEAAGLQLGDRIVAVDGDETPRWRDVELHIGGNPDAVIDLKIERDGRTFHKNLMTGSGEDGVGKVGFGPFIPFRIESIVQLSAAEEAGLQAGDMIESVSVGDKTYRGFGMIQQAVLKAEGPLQFQVRRGNQVFEKTIAPRLGKDGRKMIGAGVYQDTTIQVFGVLESFRESFNQNLQMTELTFVTVGRLITGPASMKQMSGPIDIAKFSGIAAQRGLVPLLTFMAIVSLQLGILNLLPIPILDGGVIALLGVEAILGRDLSMKVKERIFQVGFIFIVVLMGVVIFNDISKNLPSF